MQVDKTTLKDLSIFHTEEEQSVFHHLNFTQTNDGRMHLHSILSHPLQTIQEIQETQLLIAQLAKLHNDWPVSISNGTIMVLEKFYETPVDSFSPHPSFPEALYYQIIKKSDFSLIKYTVEHCITFLQGMQQIVDLLDEPQSKLAQKWRDKIMLLLSKPTVKELIQIQNKTSLSAVTALIYGHFIRQQFKQSIQELIDIYGKLDAYLSLAIAGKKYGFCFPEFSSADLPFVEVEEMFHLQLQQPVAHTVYFNPSNNFLFLTGANMGGKSTFIKAIGISVYLAHIGMGVPAKKMTLSFFDGLLSNIQVVDNIAKGESFFFNEVQRIKNTVEKISDGKKWMILIDELFKGTNQQDAVKCSITVIEGLRKMKNALFVLSTHLYEIGTELQQYSNIQFKYFETSIADEQLIFSYQLKDGISNDRLGYLILKKEGVVDLLEKL